MKEQTIQTCPFCNSDDIFFSVKKNVYVCGDCNKVFTVSDIEKDDENKGRSGLQLFFSYGHDKNREIVERIKRDLEERGHHVWIDTHKIRPGDHWRQDILNGILNSAKVIAFLSSYSTRNPGVCLDELKIAVCVKGASIKTVLLESEDKIQIPSTLSDIQWLDMSEWGSMKESEDEVFEEWYKKNFEELCKIIESSETVELHGEINLLKELLSPNLNVDKEQELLKKEFYGREWLNDYIGQWQKDPFSKALIIYGKPGSGKSAYCVNYSHYNSAVYGCFLCEWNRSATIDVRALIRTIAFRLATKLPDYRHLLLHILNESDTNINKMNPEELFEYLLSYPLNNLVDGGRTTGLIIVDGLDEAEEYGQNPLAEVFSFCVNRLPRWIKFLFTSRPEKNVSVHFQDCQSIDIVDDMPHGHNDMLRYLMEALGSHLEKIPNKLEVLHHICDLSEGLFLYATLLVGEIQNGTIDIQDIGSFPKGLNGFYMYSMRRRFKNGSEFQKIRNLCELLCVSDSVPEFVIRGTLDISQYEFLAQLDRIGSWVVCNDEEQLPAVGFCHKSVKDWFTDPAKSGCYFVDGKSGAASLARYCRAHLDNDYSRKHIGKFYAMAEDFDELETLLLEHNEELAPLWYNWRLFPQHWDHNALLDSFWNSKHRNEFLFQLQREGDSEFVLWIFRLAQKKYGMENFDRELVSIYIDIVHLSGKYPEAVEIINDFLSNYSFEQIHNDKYLLMQQVRKLHHKMFYMPVDQLLEDALSLYGNMDERFPVVYNELLFLIGGNLGVLAGNWTLAREWLGKSERYAKKMGHSDFHKRNARKLSDCLCYENNFDQALNVLLEYIPTSGEIDGRYEAYLVGALGNIYTCMDYDDKALDCYQNVLRFTTARGVIGWIAHANLGIANVYFKLGNTQEALEYAYRASSIYQNSRHEWGMIMSEALIAACQCSISQGALSEACGHALERARYMHYNACVSAIEDLCEGKTNFLKLYFL